MQWVRYEDWNLGYTPPLKKVHLVNHFHSDGQHACGWAKHFGPMDEQSDAYTIQRSCDACGKIISKGAQRMIGLLEL